MSDVMHETADITLSYYAGPDNPVEGVFVTRPVDPDFTDELELAVYLDDDSVGLPSALADKRLQIQLSGSSRALEAFGIYLVALARLDTADPDPHEHFEHPRDKRGGTVHLIVRRRL